MAATKNASLVSFLLALVCGLSLQQQQQQQQILYTLLPTASSNCNQHLDLVVAIDSSNSLLRTNFELQQQALRSLINGLRVTPDDINVGLVLFSGTVTSYPLSGNKAQVLDTISRLPYLDDSTRTDLAISQALAILNRGRAQIPKLLIVITDGRSDNFGLTIAAANTAKRNGVSIFVVGVTDSISELELRQMASSPQQVFYSQDYNALQQDLIKAVYQACTFITQPTPITPITDCSHQLDIIIAIDSSNSIYQKNYVYEKQAIASLVNNLRISSRDIRVGLIVFSGSVSSYPLSGNKQQIINNINNLPYLDDSTRTDLAITRATDLFRSARGYPVRKLLFIVTDGRATYHDQALLAASTAKNSGISIYAVGVSDAIDQQELNDLASSPQQVLVSADFQSLQSDLGRLTNKECIVLTTTPRPTPPPTTTHPPIVECNYELDVVFALDSSNSLYERRFEMAKSALANLVSSLNITTRDIRVGLVLFSGTVSSYPLNGNKNEVLYNIRNMPYLDDSTRTDLAINRAMTVFSAGARGGNVQKLLIIITDGRATYNSEAIRAASNAKASGISIYAVGVTDAIDQVELRQLASSPQQVLFSANFHTLNNDLFRATNRACRIVHPTGIFVGRK